MLLIDEDNKHLFNDIYGFFAILKNIFLCTAIIVYKNSSIKDDQPNIDINLEFDSFKPFTNKTNR